MVLGFSYISEYPGRLRIRVSWLKGFSLDAENLEISKIGKFHLNPRTGSLVITYNPEKISAKDILRIIIEQRLLYKYSKKRPKGNSFKGKSQEIDQNGLKVTKRELFFSGLTLLLRSFIPLTIRKILAIRSSLPLFVLSLKAIKKANIGLEVINGLAIATALMFKNYDTASFISFILKLGDFLENWVKDTSKKGMRLLYDFENMKVWLCQNGFIKKTSISNLKRGDLITDCYLIDKTGTLTEAVPRVVDLITFEGFERKALLKDVACVEEHFPHPVASAIVKKAKEEGIVHEEEHSEVQYIVAHGVVSSVRGKRIAIGSRHFIVEDLGIKEDLHKDQLEALSKRGYSLLYVAVEEKLAGVVLIEGIKFSRTTLKVINMNYKAILLINTFLIAGGLLGMISPWLSAILHNFTTIATTFYSYKTIQEK